MVHNQLLSPEYCSSFAHLLHGLNYSPDIQRLMVKMLVESAELDEEEEEEEWWW